MLIMCNNKKCSKTSNALLDTETMEVICQECGKPISNISEPMKRTLKSFGQVVRSERRAFTFACPNCRTNREIVLDQNNQTICKICYNPIKIHASFKLAIEEAGELKKIDTGLNNGATKKKSRKKNKK